MFLLYGLKDGQLHYVDAAPRGLTDLQCPYCRDKLIARKGQVKAHHFAHANKTCRAVASGAGLPTLPAFDRFDLELSARVLKALEHIRYFASAYVEYPDSLQATKVARYNDYLDKYEITKRGKIPFGDLSMNLFAQEHTLLVEERHKSLIRNAEKARKVGNLEVHLMKLRLYRAQLQHILGLTLYFVEVQHADGTLYKIGVTSRTVDERITEMIAELNNLLGKVQIKILGQWAHRGHVERYFLHKYQSHAAQIGTLTEYFQFESVKDILRDLRRMGDKALSPLEVEVLAGKPSSIEDAINIEQKRRVAIKRGMEKSKQRGKSIGRPKGAKESATTFWQKPRMRWVRQDLQSGEYSLRQIAKRYRVSINTVRKAKQFLDEEQS